MEQKRVSFKVAKAIKEAGYPQYGSCDEFYNADGQVVDKMCDIHKLVYPCPTYLDVWLWLWTNKNIHLIPVEMRSVGYRDTGEVNVMYNGRGFVRATPEEAIIAAIDYLVDNNLLK